MIVGGALSFFTSQLTFDKPAERSMEFKFLNMEKNGFFLDQYGQLNVEPEKDDDTITTEDLVAYIEYGRLEEARELFTRLLDNPNSCQFAQEKLDYIASLEK